MERLMSKKEIIEETVKIFGTVELPMYMVNAINAIHGGLRNLKVVLQMMEAEEQAAKQEVENEHADAE